MRMEQGLVRGEVRAEGTKVGSSQTAEQRRTQWCEGHQGNSWEGCDQTLDGPAGHW